MTVAGGHGNLSPTSALGCLRSRQGLTVLLMYDKQRVLYFKASRPPTGEQSKLDPIAIDLQVNDRDRRGTLGPRLQHRSVESTFQPLGDLCKRKAAEPFAQAVGRDHGALAFGPRHR
jgi:hypothetical protein